jgi:hypothetical protein
MTVAPVAAIEAAAKTGARAIVSDDGSTIWLTAYTASGDAVPVAPSRARRRLFSLLFRPVSSGWRHAGQRTSGRVRSLRSGMKCGDDAERGECDQKASEIFR